MGTTLLLLHVTVLLVGTGVEEAALVEVGAINHRIVCIVLSVLMVVLVITLMLLCGMILVHIRIRILKRHTSSSAC